MDVTSPPETLTWRAVWWRVGLVVLLAFAGDRLLGGVVSMLAHRDVSTGRIGAENALLRQVPDVLLLGSSHAKHHYDDSLLAARTGCAVRNAGADGTGVLYARAMLSLLPDSARLKTVVWEVSWFAGEPATIHSLDYFYGRSRLLDSLLTTNDWRASLKLRSMLYRNNGLVGPLARSLISNDQVRWGFSPLDGSLGDLPVQQGESRTGVQASPWLAGQLEGLIADVRSRGAEIVFSQGPSLVQAFPPAVDSVFRSVARTHGVPWISLTGADDARLRDPALFRDPTHLNRAGAAYVTDLLAERLSQVAPVTCP